MKIDKASVEEFKKEFAGTAADAETQANVKNLQSSEAAKNKKKKQGPKVVTKEKYEAVAKGSYCNSAPKIKLIIKKIIMLSCFLDDGS